MIIFALSIFSFVFQSLCMGMVTHPESSDSALVPKSIWPSWLVAWVGWKFSWPSGPRCWLCWWPCWLCWPSGSRCWLCWPNCWLGAWVGLKLSCLEASAAEWLSTWLPTEEGAVKVGFPNISMPSRHCCTCRWVSYLHCKEPARIVIFAHLTPDNARIAPVFFQKMRSYPALILENPRP